MNRLLQLMRSLIVLGLVLGIAACSKGGQVSQVNLSKNLVTAGNQLQDRNITEGDKTFRVVSQGVLQSENAPQEIVKAHTPAGRKLIAQLTKTLTAPALPVPSGGGVASSSSKDPASLVVGIPLQLISSEGVAQHYVFDGVVTKVSDQNRIDLGDLKLTDLTPIHVSTSVVKEASGSTSLVLTGCLTGCDENSDQSVIQKFPVVAVDSANQLLMVDLSSAGKDLDLIAELDPDGSMTHLKSVWAKTVSVDYSFSTLVFDVESHMTPVDAKASDAGVTETVFNTRWFLKLSSTFNPAFQARSPTDGVGFFTTLRGEASKVTRWSTTSSEGVAPVHYYLKNIPTRYQSAFQAAFDEWDLRLQPIFGRLILSYEFVSQEDAKNTYLVPGDPRFNIVEWDLKNRASYGGLGPSIANQFTGENITANVLIQGPHIEEVYKDWFKINEQVQILQTQGQPHAAEALLITGQNQMMSRLEELKFRPKLSLKKGNLPFVVHAQRPELNDPIAQRNDFDPLPPGLDYDKYMYGYFRDMLTHELGHNLGMRHNFKGNLGSTGEAEGQVSRSVMEYLPRDERYQDHIDEYDLMALMYAYLGKTPDHLDWNCTDEEAIEADPLSHSPECTPNDATGDPFSWYMMRLNQAVHYLVNSGSGDAPLWSVDDLSAQLKIAVAGMGYYASSAQATFSTWKAFSQQKGRPTSAEGVKPYVLATVKGMICDSALDAEVRRKTSVDAANKTKQNILDLQKRAASILMSIGPGVFIESEISCSPPSTFVN